MPETKPYWWPEPQTLIAMTLIWAMVVLAFVLIYRGKDVPDSDMLKMLVGGFMTTGFATIISFYFGSSKGSVTKDETINRIATAAPPAAPVPVVPPTNPVSNP